MLCSRHQLNQIAICRNTCIVNSWTKKSTFVVYADLSHTCVCTFVLLMLFVSFLLCYCCVTLANCTMSATERLVSCDASAYGTCVDEATAFTLVCEIKHSCCLDHEAAFAGFEYSE